MTTRTFLSWITGLVMVAVISEPALPQDVSASTTEEIIVNNDGKTQKWRTSTGVTDFNVEVRGKIELTDDDKDIKSISDDGYLEINKTVFGSKRTIVIESLGGGKVKREYYEGRSKMDWETNGRKWLSEILPELVRTSTIGAEARVNRFFKTGGAAAVLSEIEEIESDYVKAHYGKLLLQKNIGNNEIPKVINTLANEINSDYYLSSLLKESMSKLLVSDEAGSAFFAATSKVNSDYYRSVVLKEALKKYSASPTQVKQILNSASTINSDYYLSVVLTSLLEDSDVKDESLNELVTVAKNIDSDYYRTQVLSKALQKSDLSKTVLKNVVNSLGNVGSDYYKTEVFNKMAERTSIDPEIQMQIIDVLDNVGSDYYASVTLTKLLNTQKMSDDSFKALINAAGELGSSTYAAEVFQHASKKTLTNAQLTQLLKSAENIDSDHYLTSVLQALAPQVKNADSSVKDAYRQAAKKIDSETYYGRALRAIE
jgi:hypothetical protein